MNDNKRYLIHIEMIRIIALFFVMYNHTSDDGYFLFAVTDNSLTYYCSLFLSVTCKTAVPLFFMVSGALLLGKEETIKYVYQKRVLRFVIVLVTISFLHYMYAVLFQKMPFHMTEFLFNLYASQINLPLWFLYSYLGTLVMLPLLRKMIKNMAERDYIYLAVWQIIITGILPAVQLFLFQGKVSLNNSFSIPLMTSDNIFYFVMGYYFEHVMQEEQYKKKNMLCSILLFMICIMFGCYMTYYYFRITGSYSESYFCSFITLPVFSIYFIIRYLFDKIKLSEKCRKIIQTVGETTFGIYLIEIYVRGKMKTYVFYTLSTFIGKFPACIIWIAVSLMAGAVVVYFVKKIPVVRKFI